MQEQATARLQALTAHLPQSTAICSLGLDPASCFPPHPSQPAERGVHHLTITRCQQAAAPVLVHIPIPSDMLPTPPNITQSSAAESQAQAPDHKESCMQSDTHLDALIEFESILSHSAASMKADIPLMTTADKSAWWRQRLALDKHMAALLQHLETAWLGPWR